MITLNGQPINVTTFPDNTSQVWQLTQPLERDRPARVEWHFSTEGEFMHLAQLKHLLDTKRVKAELYIDYLPYGRQDKEVSNDTTFGLRTFARFVNDLGFTSVYILDPHSAVAVSLIDDCIDVYPLEEVAAALKVTGSDVIVYPDHGASMKYSDVYCFDQPVFSAEKTRDQKTGEIRSIELSTTLKYHKTALIIDDICDGGGTFVRLAKLIKLMGVEHVHLFVTHGLFTKGLKPLRDAGIDRIFTAKGEASEIQNTIAYERFK